MRKCIAPLVIVAVMAMANSAFAEAAFYRSIVTWDEWTEYPEWGVQPTGRFVTIDSTSYLSWSGCKYPSGLQSCRKYNLSNSISVTGPKDWLISSNQAFITKNDNGISEERFEEADWLANYMKYPYPSTYREWDWNPASCDEVWVLDDVGNTYRVNTAYYLLKENNPDGPGYIVYDLYTKNNWPEYRFKYRYKNGTYYYGREINYEHPVFPE